MGIVCRLSLIDGNVILFIPYIFSSFDVAEETPLLRDQLSRLYTVARWAGFQLDDISFRTFINYESRSKR